MHRKSDGRGILSIDLILVISVEIDGPRVFFPNRVGEHAGVTQSLALLLHFDPRLVQGEEETKADRGKRFFTGVAR